MIQQSTIKFISKDLIKNSLATHIEINNYHDLIRVIHENQ